MTRTIRHWTTRLMLLWTAMLLAICPAQAEIYEDHLLMEDKARGACTTLTGTVEMVVVFVSLPDAAWDDASLAQMNQALREAADTLVQEAAAYGAELSFVQHTRYAQATAAVSTGNSEEWVNELLSAAPTLPERTSSFYQRRPVLFCLNTGGRAFAHSEYSSVQAEYAVLFDGSDAGAIRHELLHLYGAWDYYLLDDLADAAEACCPDSIMLSSDAENRTDSLTAYLIGWTDTLDQQALAFLAATAHVTDSMYAQAQEGNTITGWSTVLLPGGVYTGMLSDGSRHGYGEMRWDDGDSYTGTWSWDTLDGSGTYVWADGSTYTGSFVSGSRTGKGVMSWPDGSTYSGDFLDDQRTGKGVMTYADGDCYSGDFVDGVYSGKGVYTWLDGDCYTGDFVDGQRSGRGTYTWANGSAYTGDFVDGARSGRGVYTWPGGDIYAGDFVDGTRTGKGAYLWADGGSYTGDFVDGQREGRGVTLWSDGSCYIGDYAASQQTGSGVFVWTDQNVYIGEYVNGVRTGQGVYFWPDGSAYSGGFRDNLRHGPGVYRDMNGTVLDGEWADGSFLQ